MRLNVREGRGWDRYCMACARRIVDGSLASLGEISHALKSGKAASREHEQQDKLLS